MNYELTWSFLTNQLYCPVSLADFARYSLWWMCSALIGGTAWPAAPVGGKWTLYGSSDGAGSAGLDSTDRLLLNGAYTIGKWVRATAGTNHTWVVLKSPVINGSNWYLAFDYSTAQEYQVNVYWSKAAPTGGSATARPTATDEWNGSSALWQFMAAAGWASIRHSIGMTSRGDFWLTAQRGGVPTYGQERFVMFQGTTGATSFDQYPVFNIHWYNTSGFTPTNVQGAYARKYDGSAASTYNSLNFYGGLTGAALDPFTSSILAQPAILLATAQIGSLHSMRGRLQDIFVIPGSALLPQYSSTVVDATGAVKWASVGCLLVPCNSVLFGP